MSKEKKIEAGIQIFILITATFAFAYLFREGNLEKIEKKEKISFYEKILRLVFRDDNFVSAIDLSSIISQSGGAFNPSGILSNFMQSIGGGISICKSNNNGMKCQIMSENDCRQICEGQCVKIANSISQNIDLPEECKIGACQDMNEGICAKGSPYKECVDKGGKWFPDPNGNVAECVQACCILGTEARWTTKLQCQKISEVNGLIFGESAKFDESIKDEQSCITRAALTNQVACTFDIEETPRTGKKGCELLTVEQCKAKGGVADSSGYLCSAEALNTICKPKERTACVDGLDEVYWFDSCGNRENIYDASRTGPDEKFIAKKDSCVLGSNGDWLKNQASCGNCNRMLSSRCGEATNNEKLSDTKQKVVCRDLRCKDSDGKIREHGETWCAYQSNFGVGGILGMLEDATYATDFKYGNDANELFGIISLFGFGPFGEIISRFTSGTGFLGGLLGARSMGPPGSQFFRKTCNEGVITIENCAQARSGICVETRQKQIGSTKDISAASCRLNRWQECINYNPIDRGESKSFLGKIKVELAMASCAKDPDCFVKRVHVGNNFKFPICLPKYPPGFNIGSATQSSENIRNLGANSGGLPSQFSLGNTERKSGGEQICSYASQTCPVIFLKECVDPACISVVWKCKANCECVTGNDPDSAMPSQKFVNEMSDFCTSLGDCGTKLNYVGAIGGLSSFSLTKCVVDVEPGELDKKCNNKKPVFSFPVNVMSQIGDVRAPPGKYIRADNLEALEKSIGKSVFGPSSILNSLSSGGIMNLLNGVTGGGNGEQTGMPDVNIYEGKEMMPIAGISGASSIGMFMAAKTGIISAATSPALASFGTAFTGATLAVAVAALVLSVTGLGRGMGPAGSYILLGLAGTGGALTMAGLGSLGTGAGTATIGTTATATSAAGGGEIVVAETAAAATGASSGPQLLPIGITILVIVIIIMILGITQGAGKMKKVEVSSVCKPWQPPFGGKDCEKCGQGNFSCNDYACAALGATCKLVGEAPNIRCIDASPNDVSGPVISINEGAIQAGFEMQKTPNGIKIEKNFGATRCLEDFQGVTFGVKTNEYAYCKWSFKPNAKFEEMEFMNEGNALFKEHSLTISSLKIFEYFADEGNPFAPEERRDIRIYMKCRDGLDNEGNEFVAELCVVKIDLTPPYLTDVSENNILPFGAKEGKIIVRSNERAELRWSFENKPFDEMENDFNCLIGGNFYDCEANIPLNRDEVTICVKGRDHPEWKETERENKRNTNEACLQITLKKTKTELKIDFVSPGDGASFVTNLPVYSLPVEVRTSGGITESTACYIGPNMVGEIPKESEGIFRGIDLRFNAGEQSLVIECKDGAGNYATKTTHFKVIQDTTMPEITRVYQENGVLYVKTNKPADCSYVNVRNCGFKFEEGQPMSSDSDGYLHSALFDSFKTYYIKCKDRIGNVNVDCNLIVTGSSI